MVSSYHAKRVISKLSIKKSEIVKRMTTDNESVFDGEYPHYRKFEPKANLWLKHSKFSNCETPTTNRS